MDSRIPPVLDALLTAFTAELDRRLPDFVQGLYLHGSIALGTFNPRSSDVDFVALTSRAAAPADFDHLRAIHQQLAAAYPQWPLEGSYFRAAEIGDCQHPLSPYPHYHDNRLELSTRIDQHCVTWWMLHHHGITLKGTPAQQLALTVDFGMLIAGMKHNLNTYWRGFTTQPSRMAWLLSDYGIQWAVLGVLRQYYTFVERDITSKTGAGDYALTRLPARWQRIIREAINIREEIGHTQYKTKVGRAVDALQFLRYIIHHCNTLPD